MLACAGWALTSGPFAASPAAAGPETAQQEDRGTGEGASSEPSAPSSTAATKTYASAPVPCTSITEKTITSLVPGAKASGKEIPSTDTKVRRTCSWNALKGYDYRWLDVSFEIMATDEAAQKSYEQRTTDKSGGGAVPGLGDSAYSVVNLTTESKQDTREGVVLARSANAIVAVTYNGSDFETKKAPSTDEINKGAIKAAKEAMAALENGRTG